MFSEKAQITYEPWNVLEHLGHGASARVFKVESAGKHAALKIFEPAIFKEDSEAQERLSRQLALANHDIPNLIKIYTIGQALVDGSAAPCILMELAPGTSLDNKELQVSLSPAEIRRIIAATAGAAKLLLDRGIAHRDIKPANVMFEKATGLVTLLDTGVIRPFVGCTDVSGFAFVGTRRYSPPEFLFRVHDDSVETWESITLYQLGAMAYELITKLRPYDHIKVEAQVNEEIKRAPPDLTLLDGVDQDLRNLVVLSLRRDGMRRRLGLSWEDFLNIETTKESPHQISPEDAAALATSTDTLSAAGEAKLAHYLAVGIAKIREGLLAGHAHVTFEQKRLTGEIRTGNDPRHLQPQIWISIEPAIEGPAILKFHTAKLGEPKFYTIDAGNVDSLSTELAQLSMSVL